MVIPNVANIGYDHWPDKTLPSFHQNDTSHFSLQTHSSSLHFVAETVTRCRKREREREWATTMATTRVITAAASNTTSSLIFKRPPSSSSFHILKRSSNSLSLSFKKPTLSKRLFTCRAIYRPQDVLSKEQGQPETLDYRVFFVDTSGKKVFFFSLSLLIILIMQCNAITCSILDV